MNERSKTIKYIETLKATIPEVLLKDNKELADAEAYLATLDKQIADAEAVEKKRLDKEAKATAVRMEASKKKVASFKDKVYALQQEMYDAQAELEPHYRGIVKTMCGAIGGALYGYKPTKK